MPLIKDRLVVENSWTHIEDGEFHATPNGITVPFEHFLDNREALLARNSKVGVRLSPENDPHELAENLGELDLIEISFPKYTDGRGYSQAQLLRRRLGYKGELRAVGHVLRDQILYMNRSGFDAFETERAELPSVLEALEEYSAFYQLAADEAVPVFRLRHAEG